MAQKVGVKGSETEIVENEKTVKNSEEFIGVVNVYFWIIEMV